jgi:hypothetical protein
MTKNGQKLTKKAEKQGKMKAILTKYQGPTYRRGSRIVATDSDNNKFILSLHGGEGRNISDEHRRAAEGLRDKMEWKGRLVGGEIKGGMAFVFLE